MRTAPFAEPFTRFRTQLAEAQAVDRAILPEPTAFALGTVGADGQPAVRMLLLKAADERGFVFYTNYESRKGRELLAHGKAALCFHWMPFERQVRVEGPVERVSDAEADEYFASRPRGSQLSTWVSRQSTVVASRAALEAALAEVEARYPGDVPRPPYWGGYVVEPDGVELWKGRRNRLHDRLRYRRDGDAWVIERLAP